MRRLETEIDSSLDHGFTLFVEGVDESAEWLRLFEAVHAFREHGVISDEFAERLLQTASEDQRPEIRN